ncbi:uncharacterized protein EAE98_005635 [Botrytis deweyae]|uniref:Uncharacterized protein n=1 Tax=Botrytis deweyae TaxID=2478750 RepID=A0ABQ7IMC9_9HELO|nr:uncharacterized protein EAE98_005635 [Botrytis deweyae]KAF7928579.1 hypothetical protein EAE98_005635 [Botrytis deweyae]
MASKSEKTILEASMGSYMRVLRNHNTLVKLIAAYPSLKENSLSRPSALTDKERRVFLDLPDADLEQAVTDPSSLTQEEILLLSARFWTPRADAEREVIWELLCETEEIIMGEEGAAFEASRNPTFLPNELEAFQAGSREWCDRPTRARKLQASAMAEAALPDAPEWIRRLYREGKDLWEPLEYFLCHWGERGFVKFALKYNGSKDIIDAKWYMISFNAPGSAVLPHVSVAGTALDASDKSSQQNGYEQRADVAPRILFGGQRRFEHQKDGLASSGVNTNTFLVFDRICMASVLEPGRSIESMRIRAFEVDYPVPGKLAHVADKVGVDEIWQAAQQSRNAAFVSLDTKEAGNWTPSNPMGGVFPDSVLGKRRYAKKQPLK